MIICETLARILIRIKIALKGMIRMKAPLKVMSFNIRRAGSTDGHNVWDNRKELVINWLKKQKADIIGFQELMPEVYDCLRSALPEYQFVGCGRTDQLDDEACAIAYLRSQAGLISEETFWLSDTPAIPGSKFTYSGYWTRVCTAAILLHRPSGKRIRVMNTHLDYDSDQSRTGGLRVIYNYIKSAERKESLPTLLMGDYNDEPGTPVMNYAASAAPLALKDFSTLEGLKENYTYHGFYKDDLKKIDYIYGTAGFDFRGNELGTDEKNGVYLSDHFPVIANLKY